MSSSGGGGDKVAFSLGAKKKKKKTTTTTVASEEFGVDTTGSTSTDHQVVEAQRNSSPLVIPLAATEEHSVSSSSLLLLQRRKQLQEEKASSSSVAKPKQPHADNNEKNNEDEAAAQALMQSAANHLNHKQQTDASGTNFSAQGDLVISSDKTDDNKEKQQLEQDVQTRPDTVPVDSNVYQSVPISEFGAAMLRGMGWKGSDNDNKTTTEPTTTMRRPHRLGLGATPKMPKSLKKQKTMRRPDQVERDERLQAQQREYEKRKEEQIRLDKQRTLQVGSIVYIGNQERRARMIQLQGVPGLNRVLVQYEQRNDDCSPSGNVSVKRGEVSLVDRQELDARTFREPRQSLSSTKPDNNNNTRRNREDEDRHYRKSRDNDYDRKKDSRSRRTEYDEDRRRDRCDDGRDRDREEGKRRRRRDGSPRSDTEDRSSRKRQRRGDGSSRSSSRREPKKASKHHDDNGDTHHHHHWLIPNIRVRVISDKPAKGRQYKQKGLVLDVTRGGAAATLQMADGQVLDGIPERYLETALPKPGGKAIVLTGKHRYTKGSLLERGRGKGVIQVYEDMSVLTLSLDDIAEWCGPLDDDIVE